MCKDPNDPVARRPDLSTLARAGAPNPVEEVRGIFSGSVAYILKEMANGESLSEAVASARAKGLLEPDPRDDLEGLTYVLLYLLKGQLPWQGLQAADQKEKYHSNGMGRIKE